MNDLEKQFMGNIYKININASVTLYLRWFQKDI